MQTSFARTKQHSLFTYQPLSTQFTISSLLSGTHTTLCRNMRLTPVRIYWAMEPYLTHFSTTCPSTTHLHDTLLTNSDDKHHELCAHSGILRLTTSKNKMVTSQAVVNPSIQQNILSLWDMVCRYRLILLTEECGQIILLFIYIIY